MQAQLLRELNKFDPEAVAKRFESGRYATNDGVAAPAPRAVFAAFLNPALFLQHTTATTIHMRSQLTVAPAALQRVTRNI